MTDTQQALDDAYRREWSFVLAATVRVASSLEIAEECVQEAFAAASQSWPQQGVPDKPGAWLTTTARRRALDELRRERTLASKLPLLIEPDSQEEDIEISSDDAVVADDRLRLLFLCCHPALSHEVQSALTLRLVCGLSTHQVARAYLVSEPTMAARITRGKQKIRVARIPFRIPDQAELASRLDAVLTVIHLFFTSGHTANSGDALVDQVVVDRSIDLARLLHRLLPHEAEVRGLLALLLLTDARRATRIDGTGRLVLLPQQNRAQWNRAFIDEGQALLPTVERSGARGRFVLQAAIASIHSSAPSYEQTDWQGMLELYDQLLTAWPSPVVALNRAVALAMASGLEAGLALVETLASEGQLDRYPYLPATRADLLRRLQRLDEAAEAYRQALLLVDNDVERRFLQDRLAEVTAP